MVAAESPVKLTYEDYKNTPEDERYELLDGELVMSEAPRIVHQSVDMELGTLMNLFVKENDLGRVFSAPTDVVLSDTIVVQPDLLFVSKQRAHIITEQNIQGAPDLVVEILSPSTANRDWTIKRGFYARYGVKELWIVDPDAKIVWVMLLRDGDFRNMRVYGEGQSVTSTTLEGFTVDMDEIV
jgi:Uma2 family endonuclease